MKIEDVKVGQKVSNHGYKAEVKFVGERLVFLKYSDGSESATPPTNLLEEPEPPPHKPLKLGDVVEVRVYTNLDIWARCLVTREAAGAVPPLGGGYPLWEKQEGRAWRRVT